MISSGKIKYVDKKVSKKKVVWKKSGCSKLIKLELPVGSKVVRNHSVRFTKDGIKCKKHRASKAKVLEITCIYSGDSYKIAASSHQPRFKYRKGKMVEVKSFDRKNVQCSRGIHYFDTKKEALAYDWG